MTFSLNTATLIGRISDYGVTRRKDGTASCALQIVEEGHDGRERTSYVTLDIWGTAGAAQASQLPPGSLVLVQGQIRPKKVKDVWTLHIATRELQLLRRTPGRQYDTEAVG